MTMSFSIIVWISRQGKSTHCVIWWRLTDTVSAYLIILTDLYFFQKSKYCIFLCTIISLFVYCNWNMWACRVGRGWWRCSLDLQQATRRPSPIIILPNLLRYTSYQISHKALLSWYFCRKVPVTLFLRWVGVQSSYTGLLRCVCGCLNLSVERGPVHLRFVIFVPNLFFKLFNLHFRSEIWFTFLFSLE